MKTVPTSVAGRETLPVLRRHLHQPREEEPEVIGALQWGATSGVDKGKIIMSVIPCPLRAPFFDIESQKEVERRRRGNINEGINELGRIVPNGSGEKAKGAILSRAVQYIHHLKENEARNIEKWTLEKLLMDQAMGDLQAQLEEVKRLWEEERIARQRAESELEVLRGIHTTRPNGGFGSRSRSPEGLTDGGAKRRSGDGEAGGGEDKEGRDDGEGRTGKRQRRDER
jgi:hypothetical protein